MEVPEEEPVEERGVPAGAFIASSKPLVAVPTGSRKAAVPLRRSSVPLRISRWMSCWASRTWRMNLPMDCAMEGSPFVPKRSR